MSDVRLRKLERAFQESGAVEDEAAWLRELIRQGKVFPEQVALLGEFGDPAAALATGVRYIGPHDWLISAWRVQRAGPMFAAMVSYEIMFACAEQLPPEIPRPVRGVVDKLLSAIRLWLRGDRRTFVQYELAPDAPGFGSPRFWTSMGQQAYRLYVASSFGASAFEISRNCQSMVLGVSSRVANLFSRLVRDPAGESENSWPPLVFGVYHEADDVMAACRTGGAWGEALDEWIVARLKPWVLAMGPGTWDVRQQNPRRPTVAKKKTKKKAKKKTTRKKAPARKKVSKKLAELKKNIIIDVTKCGANHILCAYDKRTYRLVGELVLHTASRATVPGCGRLAVINWINVRQFARYIGVGTLLYQAAAKTAKRLGQTLASDAASTRLTAASKGFWEKQAALGNAVKYRQRYVLCGKAHAKKLANPWVEREFGSPLRGSCPFCMFWHPAPDPKNFVCPTCSRGPGYACRTQSGGLFMGGKSHSDRTHMAEHSPTYCTRCRVVLDPPKAGDPHGRWAAELEKTWQRMIEEGVRIPTVWETPTAGEELEPPEEEPPTGGQLELWNPALKTYEVRDQDGNVLGLSVGKNAMHAKKNLADRLGLLKITGWKAVEVDVTSDVAREQTFMFGGDPTEEFAKKERRRISGQQEMFNPPWGCSVCRRPMSEGLMLVGDAWVCYDCREGYRNPMPGIVYHREPAVVPAAVQWREPWQARWVNYWWGT